ncbi:hypothetical protein HS088_TW16G00509 [Tripterygium wilfordii]|uniref:DNA polymerase epsilon subunit 2 n=1 Tax=Tripterygium wilfordii TaxID=458696 RepID=A0A7J7CJ29_TRIWF|nr:hypothetical protein HS088_TW16G00509 [Tripterygium wilfordii]
MSGAVRKKIQRKFKMRGYSLKVDALNEVLSFVSRFEGAEDEAIDLLLDQLLHESLKSSIVDKEEMHRVISLLLEAEGVGEESESPVSSSSAIRVTDVFLVPKFRYDPIKKQLYEHTASLPIHGAASAKAALYRDGFLMLFQRVSRDPHFAKPAFDTEMSHYGSRDPVCTGRRWVMGVISQLEDGHFYLEDLTASVEIDLSRAISFQLCITTGLFSENTKVVAEGKMLLEGIFQEREKSIKLLEEHDLFGSGILTKEDTVSFTFCHWLKEHSRFLFIPGPDDAGEENWPLHTSFDFSYCVEFLSGIFDDFSRHPLDGCTVHCFVKIFIVVQLLRGQYCGVNLNECNELVITFCAAKLIVFFHQDLLYRMRGPCLIPPSTEETNDPFEHIVLGDKSEQKAFKYTGITCFNPGSFSNDSTFVTYRPCTQEVEFSAL